MFKEISNVVIYHLKLKKDLVTNAMEPNSISIDCGQIVGIHSSLRESGKVSPLGPPPVEKA